MKQTEALDGLVDALVNLSRMRPALRELLNHADELGTEVVFAAAAQIVVGTRERQIGKVTGRSDAVSDLWDIPDSSPRALRSFAARGGRLAEEARALFGYQLSDLEGLVQVAEAYAKLYEEKPARRRRSLSLDRGDIGALVGRKMSPATPIADTLDIMLEAIPSGPRHELIGRLLAEWLPDFGESTGEAVRSRIRDYRRHFESRLHHRQV